MKAAPLALLLAIACSSAAWADATLSVEPVTESTVRVVRTGTPTQTEPYSDGVWSTTQAYVSYRTTTSGVWSDYSEEVFKNGFTDHTVLKPGEGEKIQFRVKWYFSSSMAGGNYYGDTLYYSPEWTNEPEPEPPAEPTAVVYAPSGFFHNVNWSGPASTAYHFYEVQQRTRNGGVWGSYTTSGITYVPNTTGTTHSANGTVTEPEDAIQFRVRASNMGGSLVSAWVETEEGDATIPDPAAPTMFTATALSATRIKLTWVDESEPGDTDQETQFEVQYRKEGDDDWNTAAVTADREYWTHNGLLAATSYEYQIRAKRSSSPAADSEWVGPITAATLSLEGFEGSEPDGPWGANVSGAIPIREASIKVLYVVVTGISGDEGSYAPILTGSPNGAGVDPVYFANLKSCGSRGLRINAKYIAANSVTPSSFDGTPVDAVFNIRVGRNGQIGVTQSGGGSSEENQVRTLYPAVLKFLIDNWENTPYWEGGSIGDEVRQSGLAFSGFGDLPENIEETNDFYTSEEFVSLCDAVLDFATKIYESGTEQSVNWSTIIPRCPGQELDSSGGFGDGGSSGGGEYEPGENDTFDTKLRPESGNEKLNGPPISIEGREANTVLQFTVSPLMWAGWSSGTFFTIDLIDPCAAWPSVKAIFDPALLIVRTGIYFYFMLCAVRNAYELLRQY
jgi:hypothetical protein